MPNLGQTNDVAGQAYLQPPCQQLFLQLFSHSKCLAFEVTKEKYVFIFQGSVCGCEANCGHAILLFPPIGILRSHGPIFPSPLDQNATTQYTSILLPLQVCMLRSSPPTIKYTGSSPRRRHHPKLSELSSQKQKIATFGTRSNCSQIAMNAWTSPGGGQGQELTDDEQPGNMGPLNVW